MKYLAASVRYRTQQDGSGVGSNNPGNAFQNSNSILTHDNLLGSTVFAGETLHIR
jgi:hypothetical protein